MLAGCILVNAFYIRSDRLTYISKFIERTHFSEFSFQEQLKNQMTDSLMYCTLLPLAGGFLVLVISAFLIYQIFTYGINMGTNLFGTCAVLLISTILVLMQGYVANDINRFPNDKNGLMNSHINLYIHVMKYALSQNTAKYPLITSIHTLMECCGFYGVDDFYNQATINYSRNHPKELNTLPFRVSNDWIRQCSITASSKHIRRICIVPRFCCRDPSNNKTCSSVEWKNNGDLESTNSIFDRPCLPAMVRNFRNQVLSITIFSMGALLTGILYFIRLLQWNMILKRKQ